MDDFETRIVFLPLIDYWSIDLAMHPALGKFPHKIGDQIVESGTGHEQRTTAAIDAKDKRWLFRHAGPTMVGVGRKVVRSEYQRMLQLKAETENILRVMEGLLERLG